MEQTMQVRAIAHIQSGFTSKFGIPRQSGLSDALRARIVFEAEYRDPEALRGLDGYSHIWLLWQFSRVPQGQWSATVRPPRLGGNKRMGVFATRSPYRPNPIGLSCVKLEGISWDDPLGPVLEVAGADLLDGTPILDIKPYLPYTDAHPTATDGFAVPFARQMLRVIFPPELLSRLPQAHREAVFALLQQDPRPAYQEEPMRRYGMEYAGYDVRFTVCDGAATVVDVVRLDGETDR